MIVPMKKVSLVIMGDKKEETLKKLRKLGIVHIEITGVVKIRSAPIHEEEC